MTNLAVNTLLRRSYKARLRLSLFTELLEPAVGLHGTAPTVTSYVLICKRFIITTDKFAVHTRATTNHTLAHRKAALNTLPFRERLGFRSLPAAISGEVKAAFRSQVERRKRLDKSKQFICWFKPLAEQPGIFESLVHRAFHFNSTINGGQHSQWVRVVELNRTETFLNVSTTTYLDWASLAALLNKVNNTIALWHLLHLTKLQTTCTACHNRNYNKGLFVDQGGAVA
jgi:hypothetical protein